MQMVQCHQKSGCLRPNPHVFPHNMVRACHCDALFMHTLSYNYTYEVTSGGDVPTLGWEIFKLWHGPMRILKTLAFRAAWAVSTRNDVKSPENADR